MPIDPKTIQWDAPDSASIQWDDAKPTLATAPSASKGGRLGGYAMGLRDPVDAGAQILRRVVPDGIGKAVDTFGNWLADHGLPVARSEGVAGVDNIVKVANQEYDQSRHLAADRTLSGLITGKEPSLPFDWARLAGNVVNPATLVAAPEMAGASTVKALALAGAKGGAIGGVMQPVTENTADFWTQKAQQAAAGAAAGTVATPLLAKGAEGVSKGVQYLAGRVSSGQPVSNTQASIAVTNVFRSQGVDLADVPEAVRQSVGRQVSEALAAKQRMDPAAMIRRAQFEAVGLTNDAAPTLGQVTRDPIQFAAEKNLSGVRIKTAQGEGSPLADRFATQNRRLQEVFDMNGAKSATDRTSAGQTIIDALRAADVPVKAGVDGAYHVARSMTGGRAADLERGTFSQAANDALDQGMLGHALPADVRSLLNDISSGKTPFNVDAAVQIDTILSRAQRVAERAGNDNAKHAVGVVRDALHSTPLARADGELQRGASRAAGEAYDRSEPLVTNRVAGRSGQPGPLVPLAGAQASSGTAQTAATDAGQAARDAFNQARAAARSRFATIEQTPALKAALDDASPDNFVQRFVLGADARDVQALKRVLENSPEALAQARAQIADTLKRAAFGGNLSGDAGFAPARYDALLRSMGRQKLETFFTPEEIVRMNLAGKVASDINSVPAGARYAVNSSGTGAALMNLLTKLAESPLMRKVPFARQLSNHIGEVKTENAINRALQPTLAQEPREMSPEAIRAIQRLFPLAATGAGSLGGALVQ